MSEHRTYTVRCLHCQQLDVFVAGDPNNEEPFEAAKMMKYYMKKEYTWQHCQYCKTVTKQEYVAFSNWVN